jgi:hypothetical protein
MVISKVKSNLILEEYNGIEEFVAYLMYTMKRLVSLSISDSARDKEHLYSLKM